MRLIVLVIGIAVLVPVSSLAVTLKPGTYKLEWRIPDGGEDRPGSYSQHLGRVSECIAFGATGLVSRNAMWATADNYVLLLDESRGTGKGYDVAYAAPVQGWANLKIDVASATKIPLRRTGHTLVPDLGGGVVIDLVLGGKDSRITKPAVIDVVVNLRSGANDTWVPDSARFAVRGGWHGKIDADGGEVEARTLDCNGNGVFDNAPAGENDSDAIFLMYRRKTKDGDIGTGTQARLGKASSYAGKLYDIEVSQAGDTLYIRRHCGEAGRLRIDARDGFGKPACLDSIEIGWDCRSHGLWAWEPAAVELPVGEYRGLRASVGPKHPDGTWPEVQLTIARTQPFRIAKDETTTIRVGGPVKVEIQPGAKAVEARRGEVKRIGLAVKVGDDQILEAWDEFPGRTGIPAKIRILNSRGKTLRTDTASFECGDWQYSLRIPRNWKPGTYKITATLDLRPYQKPVSAEKTLKVVE